MKGKVKLGSRWVGNGEPAYIIAEMSANHAGSLSYAKEIICAAKEAGADCVKFQTYTPDTITFPGKTPYFEIERGTWAKENLYELYSKAFTPWEWHDELFETAKKLGMDAFSTPFDATAVDFLEALSVPFYKIASFELVDIPLIRYVASKKKPVVMSTGMGTEAEIKEAVDAIRGEGNEDMVLLRCQSAYPAVPESMRLSVMRDMAEKFQVPVGLSDHSMGSLMAVAGVMSGACVIEKHFCISRSIPNPDAAFSMEPEEFAAMVRDIRTAEAAVGTVQYGPTEEETDNLRFRKSIFAVKDILPGDVFTKENVRVIRPADGMHPRYYEDVLGRVAATEIKAGNPLREENIRDWK